jgi:hypothetical protein
MEYLLKVFGVGCCIQVCWVYTGVNGAKQLLSNQTEAIMGYFVVTPEQADQRRKEAERNRKLGVFFGFLYVGMSVLGAVMAVSSILTPEAYLPYAAVILFGVTVFAAVKAVTSFRKAKEFAEQRNAIKAVWSGTVGRPSKETVR